MHTLNGASSPGAPFPRGVTRARRSRVTCSLKEPIKLHKDVNTTSIVVIERRAADVAVIGDDPSAFLTAYTLAKGGKKVGKGTIQNLGKVYSHVFGWMQPF